MLFFKKPSSGASLASICQCGTSVFFENTVCLSCGRLLGYVPQAGRVMSFSLNNDGTCRADDPSLPGRLYRTCENRTSVLGCNWMIPAEDFASQCSACQLTRTYPDLTIVGNDVKWSQAEAAKRRVAAQLVRLGIPLVSLLNHPMGVCFDIMQTPLNGGKVLTGHEDGVITINVEEADPAAREFIRQQMGEEYRTLAGHIRHELAHYFWDVLAHDPAWVEAFRKNFGDEQLDYSGALAQYYAAGARPDWSQHFIAAYASAHPWEDWAETFAHFLHLEEGVHVARTFHLDADSLQLGIEKFEASVLGSRVPKQEARAFLNDVNSWVKLSLVNNEMARALGHPNSYPFVLNAPVVRKLWFIRQSVPKITQTLQKGLGRPLSAAA